MMNSNSIVLPGWLGNKAVFQQGVEFAIDGKAAPAATVTMEIVKDPTDGRRVSKLDTDYGVILSRETTTSSKGDFHFEIPAYKASTDTYTFIFKCMNETLSINDIRCGDVWVFLGSEFLSIPMKEANAPATPLKRKVMSYLRFLTPSRNGLETGEEEISFQPKDNFKDAHWIKITDTNELSLVSSSAFSFAYNLADQISYPVGVIDLAVADSSILNWISKDGVDHNEALKDYLEGMGIYLDEERYNALVEQDKKKVEAAALEKEINEGRSVFDFDLSKEEKLRELKEGKKTEDSTSAGDSFGLDFPSVSKQQSSNEAKSDELLPESAAKNLNFNMIPNAPVKKEEDKTEFKADIKRKFRMSLMYAAKIHPLRGVPVRGFAFSPNREEMYFDRYDLLLMGLLTTLAESFEPREVYDEEVMPSILFVGMHPDNVDFKTPYSVLEFNENVHAFTKRLVMPSGVISMHDLLLPDKTKSFTLGTRLSIIAMGIHITPKMPKSCPELSEVTRAGNKLILKFENTGDGLRLAEGQTELLGFDIAGPDRVFYPANARILHGVRVMVWRDDIEEPVSVSYGYRPFPHQATFKNLADLPVLPFRFDREPSEYGKDLFFASCDSLEFVGKRTETSDFEKLNVFRTIKGNGVINTDNMNKTQGNASLHIRYETDKSFYGFEPVLDYASLMAPITLLGRDAIVVDVFNPDQRKKKLIIENFGEAEIKPQLTWQTLTLKFNKALPLSFDSLHFIISDSERHGEIYVDNIRFIKL